MTIHNKYTRSELELCIGYECSLGYAGALVHGIILKVYNNGYENLVIVQKKNQNILGEYFIDRIKNVPILDKLKDKKLWKLIRPCTE